MFVYSSIGCLIWEVLSMSTFRGFATIAPKGRLHKKRAGGEISQKGTKDTILTSYPWTDLRDDHWGDVYL